MGIERQASMTDDKVEIVERWKELYSDMFWLCSPDGEGNGLSSVVEHPQVISLIEELSAAEQRIERLTDLVRYERHHLYDAELIDEEEFAALVMDSENGKRVTRLESYDKMRQRAERAEEENRKLKAPVSDAEVKEWECDWGVPYLSRSGVNTFIAARAASHTEAK